jgi:hypothetical protein
MTKQQTLAIRLSALLGGAFLSIVAAAVAFGGNINSEIALRILLPGLGLVPVVHNALPAIIVMVIVDAIVYCAATYFIVWSVLWLLQRRQQP